MRIVIAGGHGKIALLLGELATRRGEQVVGIVRNPDHAADLAAVGMSAVVRDLEGSSAQDLAGDLAGADVAVFAAGAGPGSGAARKDTVDRAAAALFADAAQAAGVPALLLVSSIGVDAVRDGAEPAGVEEVFLAYLRAKLAAEEDLLSREGLAVCVLRPAALTDDAASDRVELAAGVDAGRVPRADVAAVLLALADRLLGPNPPARVLGLAGGRQSVAEAVAAV